MHHHPSKSEQHRSFFFTWKACVFKQRGLTLAFILLLEVKTVIKTARLSVAVTSCFCHRQKGTGWFLKTKTGGKTLEFGAL